MKLREIKSAAFSASDGAGLTTALNAFFYDADPKKSERTFVSLHYQVDGVAGKYTALVLYSE